MTNSRRRKGEGCGTSMSSSQSGVMNRADQSPAASSPASTAAASLQSEADPSAPQTRTRTLTRSRDLSASPPQATSTDSADSTRPVVQTTAPLSSRASISYAACIQPAASVSVRQEIRGRATPIPSPSSRCSTRTPTTAIIATSIDGAYTRGHPATKVRQSDIPRLEIATHLSHDRPTTAQAGIKEMREQTKLTTYSKDRRTKLNRNKLDQLLFALFF